MLRRTTYISYDKRVKSRGKDLFISKALKVTYYFAHQLKL